MRRSLSAVAAGWALRAHAERDFSGTTASGAYYRIAVPDSWKTGDTLVLFQHGLTLRSAGAESRSRPDRGSAVERRLRDRRVELQPALVGLVHGARRQCRIARRVQAAGRHAGRDHSLRRIARRPDRAEAGRGSALRTGARRLCGVSAGGRFARLGRRHRPAPGLRRRLCRRRRFADRRRSRIRGPTTSSDIPDNLSDLQDEAQLLQTLIPLNQCTGVNLPKDTAQRRDAAASDGADEPGPHHQREILRHQRGLRDLCAERSGARAGQARRPESVHATSASTTAMRRSTRTSRASTPIHSRRCISATSRISAAGSAATKVISIQTSQDQLVIPANQYVLRQTLPATQLTSALVNESTPSHCGFTLAEGVGRLGSPAPWIGGAPQPSVNDLQTDCTRAMAQRRRRSVPLRCEHHRADVRQPGAAAPASHRAAGRRALQRAVVRPGAQRRGHRAGSSRRRPCAGIHVYLSASRRTGPAGLADRRRRRARQRHRIHRRATFFARLPAAPASRALGPHRPGVRRLQQRPHALGRTARLGFARSADHAHHRARTDWTAALPRGIAPTQASGSWYDPRYIGSGFVFEQLDAQRVAAIWFGFDGAGNQIWLSGIAQQGVDGYAGTFYQPIGPRFGSAYDLRRVQSGSAARCRTRSIQCIERQRRPCRDFPDCPTPPLPWSLDAVANHVPRRAWPMRPLMDDAAFLA